MLSPSSSRPTTATTPQTQRSPLGTVTNGPFGTNGSPLRGPNAAQKPHSTPISTRRIAGGNAIDGLTDAFGNSTPRPPAASAHPPNAITGPPVPLPNPARVGELIAAAAASRESPSNNDDGYDAAEADALEKEMQDAIVDGEDDLMRAEDADE